MSARAYLTANDGIADCRPSVFVFWDRERGGLTIRLIHTLTLLVPWGRTVWMPEAHAVMDDFGDLVVTDGDGA